MLFGMARAWESAQAALLPLKKEGSGTMPTSKPSLPLFMPSATEGSSQTPLSMKADLPVINSVVEEA
ncbi:hypothetical protein D3C80_1299540 [compost metagenome]